MESMQSVLLYVILFGSAVAAVGIAIAFVRCPKTTGPEREFPNPADEP